MTSLTPALIPLPQQFKSAAGHFTFDQDTRIFTDDAARKSASLFADWLRDAMSLTLSLICAPTDSSTNIISFKLNSSLSKQHDAYELSVNEHTICITAANEGGFFQATRCLRQLLPIEIESNDNYQLNSWVVPCVSISDASRFQWRGLLIDPARNFYQVNTVKRIVDLIALYGFNRLHLHITDDQGWRFIVPDFPKLHANQDHYSNQDINEIVQYAADRQVMVIPEIDMPGHTAAAMCAYPEYSCRGVPVTMPTRGGNYGDIFCPGNESAFSFIERIIEACAQLFPAPYIHVGGDEAVKRHWQECPHCKQRMADENLKDFKDLEHYFIKRVESIVRKTGKQMIGWDEIFELHAEGIGHEVAVHYPSSVHDDPIEIDTIVQSWRDPAAVKAAAEIGHQVIVSNHSGVYISRGNRSLPLEDVYQFNPLPDDLSKNAFANIAGVECCLWEVPEDTAAWSTLLLPRLSAVAELAWSQAEQLNLNSYTDRLLDHRRRWQHMGLHNQEIKWASASYAHPIVTDDDPTQLSLTCTFKNTANETVSLKAVIENNSSISLNNNHFGIDVAAHSSQTCMLTFHNKETWESDNPVPFLVRWTATFASNDQHLVTETWTQAIAPEKRRRCPMISTSPNFDGSFSFWENNMPYHLPDSGSESAQFGIHQDKDFVYLGVLVQKLPLVIKPDELPFAQDCIEIRFDGRNDLDRFNSDGEFEFIDVLPICISPSQDESLHGSIYREQDLCEGIRIVSKVVDGGYMTEVAVPHDYFNAQQGCDWQAIRVNVSVGLHDGTESEKITWRPLWRSQESFPWSGTFYR